MANAAGEVVAVAFLLPALAVLSKDWAVLPIPIPNEALFDRAALLLIELLLTRMPLPTMALVFMVVSAQLEMLLLPAETARMGLRIPILMVGSSRAARLLVVVVVMRALAARAGLVVRPSSLAMAVEPMPRSRGGGRAIVLAASVVTNARSSGQELLGSSFLIEDTVDLQYSTHEGNVISTVAFVSQAGAPPKLLCQITGGDHGRSYSPPWQVSCVCAVLLECLPDIREKFMLADPRSGGKLSMGFFSVANNGSRAYTIARKPIYGGGGAVRYEDAAYRMVVGTWNGGPEALYRDGSGSGNIDTLDPQWREWVMMLYRDPTSSINRHPRMVAFADAALFNAADETTHCVTDIQGNSSSYFAYRRMDTRFTLACSIFGRLSLARVIDELSIRLAGGAQGGLPNAPANAIVYAACSKAFMDLAGRGTAKRRPNLVDGDLRGPGYWNVIRGFRDRYMSSGRNLTTNQSKALEEDAYQAVLALGRPPYVCIFGANNERTYFPLIPTFFKRLVYYDVSIAPAIFDPYAPDVGGGDE